MRHALLIAFLTIAATASAPAAAPIYVPLGRWTDPQALAYRQWEAGRQIITGRASDSGDANRPELPGLRPRNVELLQDAIRRKASTKVTSDTLARKHILRLARSQKGLNVLRGAMAEAFMIERNPDQNWAYVQKPNAPQHDLTRLRPDGVRENAQVKCHMDGNPARYAAEMNKDWRAANFAVPDDHVQPLRAYLKGKYFRCQASGDVQGMKAAGRKLGRVTGLGATSSEIRRSVSAAARHLSREEYATYTSLGASLALSLGPVLWDWANGDLAANQALYRGARAMSLLGVGIGTDLALQTFRGGALRGTLGGNAIVGAAVTITEVTWLVYEHGWLKAFSNPDFYKSVGGSVGGIALGLIAGGAAAAWVPGPGWVVGGVSMIAGAVAGTVGYFGGRAATHMIIEMVAPQMLRQQVFERLNEVRSGIESRLAAARAFPALN